MVSLSNSKDIIANSISVIKGNQVIDVLDTLNAVQGLAPETLNSLEKLANALDNNPTFYANVAQAIDQKADTTYVNTQLNNKVDVTAFASNIITLNNTLNTKAPKESATFSGTTTMTGSLDVSTPGTTITAKTSQAAPSSNLNLNGNVLLNGANIEQSLNSKANQSTTYTKTEVDTKFTDIINSAPDALNTLSELANALANDSNYSSTIANQLATKAPQATTYTKGEVDAASALKANVSSSITVRSIESDTKQVNINDNVI